MEPLARVTLLGVLSRGQYIFPRAGGDGSFAVWNGSRAELPLVEPRAQEDARVKDPAAQWVGVRRGGGRDENGRLAEGDEVLEGEAYTAVMLFQTLVVLGVIGFLGVRMVGEEDKRHYESWNIIWDYACPPLLLLLSLSLAALLMHLVGSLTVIAYLWIQSTGALMATFSGIVLIAASLGTKDVDGHPQGDFGGFLAILAGALIIWFVSYVGFMQAFWRWTRVPPPSRRRERGYGTTSGGLAIEDEGWEGLGDG